MVQPILGTDSPLDRIRQTRRAGKDTVARRQPASRFKRKAASQPESTLSTLERVRLHRILATPVDFVDSPEFHRRNAKRRIFDDAPDVPRADVAWYRPLLDSATSSTTHKKGATGSVILTAEQESIIFLQYNYSRFYLQKLKNKLGNRFPSDEVARELLYWDGVAHKYREQIAETNLALVLAMAKRTRMNEVDFGDMVSEGNMALLRSVDKFDCGRGFKFSTYACRAILKAFSRQGMKLTKYRQRFPTDFDPAMEKSNHLEILRDQHKKECADEVKHIFLNNDADLTDVERTVIHHRFGLDGVESATPLTLEQVGQIIGVTKERVRQIQNKALNKIRLALEQQKPLPKETLETVHQN